MGTGGDEGRQNVHKGVASFLQDASGAGFKVSGFWV